MQAPSPLGNVPRNWAQAHEFFEGRRFKANTYRNIVPNTSVRCLREDSNGDPVYAIQLYATDIVVFHKDGTIELDDYESPLTNSRRIDAGVPTIHTARSMRVPRADYLYHQTRWDISRTGEYPYGLPALPLVINPKGLVETIDGVPLKDYKEQILAPNKKAQAVRRRTIRELRNLVKPVTVMRDEVSPLSGFTAIKFDLDDAEDLLANPTYERIAQFIEDHITDKPGWDWPLSGTYADALEYAIRKFTPSANKTDRSLWTAVEVRPSELESALGKRK